MTHASHKSITIPPMCLAHVSSTYILTIKYIYYLYLKQKYRMTLSYGNRMISMKFVSNAEKLHRLGKLRRLGAKVLTEAGQTIIIGSASLRLGYSG